MSSISGACSLLIRGENLNKQDISEGLKISPTSYTPKGQLIQGTKFKAPKDVWTYEVKIDNEVNPNDVLYKLILKFKRSIKYLNIASFDDISIRLYLQSDLAQMYCEIQPNVLKELAALNIRFEISILSWGGVEDK